MPIINPQPKDVEGTTIQGSISIIPLVDNYTTISGVWYPITLNSSESKQIILQPRDTIDWYFATTSGAEDYFTIKSGAALSASLVTTSGDIVGWVSANQATVFELLIGV